MENTTLVDSDRGARRTPGGRLRSEPGAIDRASNPGKMERPRSRLPPRGHRRQIAHRVKRVLVEERPQFERVQPDLMSAALAYHDGDVDEELAIFDFTRRQMGRILNASPSEAWERTGVVGDRGAKTIAQMLNGAVEHLRHHLRFIVEKRQALGLGQSAGPNCVT